jgi:hypothetical protein
MSLDNLKPIPQGHPKPTPKCFLSYQSRSRSWARRLKQDLITAGCSAWFDDDEILAGHPIITEIVRGIQQSDVFILIWTQAAAKSVWVSDEILRALHKKASSKDGYLIIVLRRDKTPLPEGLSEYRWLRADDPHLYPTTLKQLLDSIADKFGGYVFTANLPERRDPLYKLMWTYAESAPATVDQEIYNETLSLWDVESGQVLSALDFGDSVGAVAFIQDDVLAAGIQCVSDDPDEHDVVLLRVPGLTKIHGARLFGGEDYPWCIRASEKADYLAVLGGSHGGSLALCDPALNLIKRAKIGVGLSAAWTKDDQLFIASQDCLKLLHIPSCKVARDFGSLPFFPHNIVNITADAQGKYVVCSGGTWSGGPGVLAFHLESGRVFQMRAGEFIPASCLSPNGRLLAWADRDDKHISIAELPVGKLHGIPEAKPIATIAGHARRVSALAFDRKSELLASGCIGGFVLVWRLPALERVAKFKVAQGVEDLAFTPDSRRLVVANMHPRVEIIIND